MERKYVNLKKFTLQTSLFVIFLEEFITVTENKIKLFLQIKTKQLEKYALRSNYADSRYIETKCKLQTQIFQDIDKI